MIKPAFLKILLVLALSALLVSCKNHFPFVYHTEVQQGNILDEKKVAQLKVGMTIPQVEYLLGMPISQDAFVSHRWDYVYYLKPTKGPVEIRRVTLLFDDHDLVKSVRTEQMDEPNA